MPSPIYITSTAAICKNVAFKDGVPIFENKGISLFDFLQNLYQHLAISYPKFYKMDMLCKLGFLASEILIHPSVHINKYNPYETGIVLSNAQSSLDNDCKYVETMNTNPSPSLFVYTLPNILIGEICIRNKIKGESAFFISDNFNVEFIEKYIENLFNNNNLQACICGWVDVLGEDYNAVLFYLEKEKTEKAILFNRENIYKVYQINNG